MRHTLAAIAASIAFTACGGGGDEITTTAPPPAPTQASEAAPTPAATALQLALDAPVNNLDLAPATAFSATSTSTSCGYALPEKTLTGVVSSVHDGDTIKIGTTNIRLDGIDAPELAQTYGTQSRDNLAALVLNKQVTVHYSKVDKYGRTVGSVLTSGCTFANLEQVRTGSAWHYKQYQCEQSASIRGMFASAQSLAETADLGLWSFVATPPWVYRNGTNPAEPTCTSDDPLWVSVIAPAVSTPSPTAPPVANACFKVWVNGYRRSNGTYVSGYYRNSPGCD